MFSRAFFVEKKFIISLFSLRNMVTYESKFENRGKADEVQMRGFRFGQNDFKTGWNISQNKGCS